MPLYFSLGERGRLHLKKKEEGRKEKRKEGRKEGREGGREGGRGKNPASSRSFTL